MTNRTMGKTIKKRLSVFSQENKPLISPSRYSPPPSPTISERQEPTEDQFSDSDTSRAAAVDKFHRRLSMYHNVGHTKHGTSLSSIKQAPNEPQISDKDGIATLSVFKGKFRLSAADFSEVWMHYDLDCNGYIEQEEIDQFIRDLFQAQGQIISEGEIAGLKATLLDCYDKNGDGKIELTEMSKILPVENNFLLKFKIQNKPLTYPNFMRIWEHYDTDNSGHLDKSELQNFIKDLIKTNKNVTIKSKEMSQITNEILQHFDTNQDGAIDREELRRLLKLPDNYFDNMELYKNLTKREFNQIFRHYDRDGGGYLERDEMLEIVGDMMRRVDIQIGIKQLELLVENLMKVLDKNQDNKISKSELGDLFFTSPGTVLESDTLSYFGSQSSSGTSDTDHPTSSYEDNLKSSGSSSKKAMGYPSKKVNSEIPTKSDNDLLNSATAKSTGAALSLFFKHQKMKRHKLEDKKQKKTEGKRSK